MLMMIAGTATAQEPTSDEPGNYVWMDANAAVGNNAAADVGMNVNIKELLFTLEYQGIADGGFCLICDEPPTTLSSVNLLTGKMWKEGLTYISLSGGLGIGKHRDPYKSGEFQGLFFTHNRYSYDKSTILTVPLQVKAGIAAKVISLQMKAGLNINSKMTTFHIGLGIGAGKFF